MDNNHQDFINRYFFREQNPAQRTRYHAAFWLAFIALHLLYFIDSGDEIKLTPRWVVSYGLYYFRFVPVFYLSVLIFDVLKHRYQGLDLVIRIVVLMVLLMHVMNVSLFLLLESVYGLQSLSSPFQHFGQNYLRPISESKPSEILILLMYDLTEIQLLFLPIGLKMTKFGLLAQIQKLELQADKLKNELQTLRSQPAPHFVLNAVNAAYAEIQPVSERAAEYLEDLTGVLHFALYETTHNMILLHKEWNALLHFVHMESKRFDDRLRVSINQDGDMSHQVYIPTLMLITLTENAFKHGVYKALDDCWIDILLTTKEGELIFMISNSKTQNSAASQDDDNSGIGLANIRQRLELYFPKNHQLQISENKTSFTVRIRFALKAKA
ncbi:sensor histidine kinase [Dyadobacter pollutisoli]|uniref:Histidine kinase n=1 Tax=Dyadobacter pollutisoli TaxID=2910158 RepID=A0A9E8NFD4_9BACT|nr:histidine kinase [Dyadobacter pollutisoli]WAC13272.1 histidine kinase [Dyadobacter pollutisoli]